MTNLINALIADEAGFIVSAELVLVATIAVLAMIIGLSEVALNINNELEDVGASFGNMSQSFRVGGLKGHLSSTNGSGYGDRQDHCDDQSSIVCNNDSNGEAQ